MLSHVEENYLKEIYGLQEATLRGVSTNSIAEKMQTKASSVTDMLQRLSNKDLVVYTKYKGSRLSEKGRLMAISIVRKHRLWETFLVEKLNFLWDEVHDIAEQLEHIKSDKLIKKLEAFLGNPKFDPHGHPIPNSNGQINKLNSVSLAEFKIKEEGVFVGVKDSSDSFLKYLNKMNIAIGDTLKLLYIEPFDNSFLISANTRQFNISENVAKNLYLRSE
ncbi:metal-dependent transcriptional regulator [Arenibacter sp. F20364]|uniref:metal-dependent transcriptional regulator n=1 Tax=Arenibacter sp. F20364 TaxID=2926415 RepID=UPI001FF281D2|nr:metal-dependent transcriptional regulator [Arenibacter sp. F20364]MCK0189213.1 metal-dependent transcriptional regulator [Arenibacter sp. F20364]